MKKPIVAVTMLVNGRQEMVNRAVRSFELQTYRPAYLLVLDTGKQQTKIRRHLAQVKDHGMRVSYLGGPLHKHTIGSLRNLAAGLCSDADILCHFDSDDWSHPRRIEEQVALLVASGKQCVGYNAALFWDTRTHLEGLDDARMWELGATHLIVPNNEAWLYSNPNPSYALDASRMMWREYWEANPYEDAPHADRRWDLKHTRDILGISSIVSADDQPRLICGIHGDNMSSAYNDLRAPSWRRAEAFDQACAERMRL